MRSVSVLSFLSELQESQDRHFTLLVRHGSPAPMVSEDRHADRLSTPCCVTGGVASLPTQFWFTCTTAGDGRVPAACPEISPGEQRPPFPTALSSVHILRAHFVVFFPPRRSFGCYSHTAYALSMNHFHGTLLAQHGSPARMVSEDGHAAWKAVTPFTVEPATRPPHEYGSSRNAAGIHRCLHQRWQRPLLRSLGSKSFQESRARHDQQHSAASRPASHPHALLITRVRFGLFSAPRRSSGGHSISCSAWLISSHG